MSQLFRPILLMLVIILTLVSSQDLVAEESDGILQVNEINVTVIPATSTLAPPTTTLTTSTTTLTTPPPTKNFPKNIGSWNVPQLGNGNSSCIIFHGALQLQLKSNEMFGNGTDTIKIDVPSDALATNGTCGNITQILRLEWETSSNTSNFDWSFEIEFGFLPSNNKQYGIQKFALFVEKFNASEHKTAEGNITLDSLGPYFSADFNHSYLCNSINLVSGTGNLTVATSSLQFEAFRPNSTRGIAFSKPENCKTDKTELGTIIGIAVGSLIAVLLGVGLGVYVAIRYGYCRMTWCCCNRGEGYQRLDI